MKRIDGETRRCRKLARNCNRGSKKRAGNLWTATAFIITANAGTGTLYLSWTIAQMGWIIGPLVILAFCTTTIFTAHLLCKSYRFPDPVIGERNPVYSSCVKRILGKRKGWLCAVAQYADLYGVCFAYTIIGSNSVASIARSFCIRENPSEGMSHCKELNSPQYMILFGAAELVLAQIPGFHRAGWLSMVSAATSLMYSFILLGLSIAKVIEDGQMKLTNLWMDVQPGLGNTFTYREIVVMLQAIGNIAYSYGVTSVLIEIEDTLKSPPVEYKTMIRATTAGITISTFLYLAVGCVGYAAFGMNTAGDLLTNFGTVQNGKLFWLVDLANLCLIIRLTGGYQMCIHLIFEYVESRFSEVRPRPKFWNCEGALNWTILGKNIGIKISFFRIAWRFFFVVATTAIAMLFPFFNSIIGFWGSLCYWPIAIYFPIEMHIAQFKIPARSAKWIGLKCLSFIFMAVSLGCMFASMEEIILSLRHKY